MPSIQLRRDDVIVGVDTHKDEHVAVLLDGLGGRLAELFLPATAAGFAELLTFCQGRVVAEGRLIGFGVEGTGSYGVGLARFLRRRGHTVHEVHRPPRNGDSVALRHVVASSQLPQAFALNEWRGHAISLVGQPTGGLLYGIKPVLPLAADLVSFGTSAALSASISHPLRPSVTTGPRPRVRDDLLTGLRHLWQQPFLRSTLFAAAAYQLVFGAATSRPRRRLHRSRRARYQPRSPLRCRRRAGGILGALATPKLQTRLRLKTLIVIMGWTAAGAFAAIAWLHQPLLAGVLLGCIYFTAAPANAVLLAAQISQTLAALQGRVMAASYLIAGLAAPLGPPLSGITLETTGPAITFTCIAAITATITIVIHLNRPMRDLQHHQRHRTHPTLTAHTEGIGQVRNPTYMLVTAAGVVTQNPTGALLGCLCIDQSGPGSSNGTGRSVMT